MRLELTEKDILLVKLASCILIAFLMIRFLIMPGIGEYQDRLFQKQGLEQTVEEMQASMDAVPEMEISIEKQKEALAKESASYYPQMENRQVDELLTGLAVQSGLFPVSLSIEEARAWTPGEYLYLPFGREEQDVQDVFLEQKDAEIPETDSGEGESVSPEDSSEAGETGSRNAQEQEENGTQSADDMQGHYVLTGFCTMAVRGTEANLSAFLDTLEQSYPAVQVRAMNRSERTWLDAKWNVVEEPEVSFTLAVSMYDGERLEK